MQKTITINSLDELPRAAKEFAEVMDSYTVFAFYGQMGAGKTTFINALCTELGVDDITNSPSFSIINEYRSDTTAANIYHIACYRLASHAEAEDIGVEDYVDSGAVCLIEWPERIAELLPYDTVRVDITVNDDDSRTMTLSAIDLDE